MPEAVIRARRMLKDTQSAAGRTHDSHNAIDGDGVSASEVEFLNIRSRARNSEEVRIIDRQRVRAP
jgi:hypothetical protein